jgi:hypothetical protein
MQVALKTLRSPAQLRRDASQPRPTAAGRFAEGCMGTMHNCEKWVRFAKMVEDGLRVAATKGMVVGLVRAIMGGIIEHMFYFVKSRV